MALCGTLTLIISFTYVFLVSCPAICSIPLKFWNRGAITFLKGKLFTSSQASCKSLLSPSDITNMCLVHQRKMHTNLITSTHIGLVRYHNSIFHAVSLRPWQSCTQNFSDAKPKTAELDTQGLHFIMWCLPKVCLETGNNFCIPPTAQHHKDLKV